MSDIYLTKIERKTIFTKALIFVLIMFVISDLTVTGPFYFNFIPWLFILGVVGNLKKIDSVLMCFIASFTVFISSILTEGGVYLSCGIDVIVTLATLVLGIITGKILYEFVLEHRLVKYIKRSKKVFYIIAATVMFLVSYLMVGLNSGNIVTYIKSKSNLERYISRTYGIQEYEIVQTKYNRNVSGKYTYSVKIDGQEVHFVPYTKTIFKDANRDARFLQASCKLEHEIGDKAEKVMQKYSSLVAASATFKLEYNDFLIAPDTVVLTIECKTLSQDEKELDKLYYELASCIKELQTVKQPQKVIIKLNDKTLQLTANNLEQLDKDYIKGGFEIKEITE